MIIYKKIYSYDNDYDDKDINDDNYFFFLFSLKIYLNNKQ